MVARMVVLTAVPTAAPAAVPERHEADQLH
jgi:hypothetical protein